MHEVGQLLRLHWDARSAKHQTLKEVPQYLKFTGSSASAKGNQFVTELCLLNFWHSLTFVCSFKNDFQLHILCSVAGLLKLWTRQELWSRCSQIFLEKLSGFLRYEAISFHKPLLKFEGSFCLNLHGQCSKNFG